MKRFALVLISLLFTFTTITGVFAADKTANSKTRQITGNITSIDTKSNSITVNKKSKEVAINIGEKTKIVQCTYKTKITDIKIGDKVTVKYKETNSSNTANTVTIREVSE
jgi:Cu/Ag efflux protein CusF